TELKLANLDRPMVQCIQSAGTPGADPLHLPSYQVAANLKDEFHRWNILNAVLLTECRNRIVKAAADRLGSDLVLIGKGWQRLGLVAQKEHSGVPGAKDYYASAKASLNLFGGCVHGGMPLRPYEIAASNGLLFTQYNRELPALFEPGRECVAFRDTSQMLDALDRILASPAEFDAVVDAGRRRVIAEHTWEKRLEKVLAIAKERFGVL